MKQGYVLRLITMSAIATACLSSALYAQGPVDGKGAYAAVKTHNIQVWAQILANEPSETICAVGEGGILATPDVNGNLTVNVGLVEVQSVNKGVSSGIIKPIEINASSALGLQIVITPAGDVLAAITLNGKWFLGRPPKALTSDGAAVYFGFVSPYQVNVAFRSLEKPKNPH